MGEVVEVFFGNYVLFGSDCVFGMDVVFVKLFNLYMGGKFVFKVILCIFLII